MLRRTRKVYPPVGSFDPRQLAKGILVELEHTDDFYQAMYIAMDHLMENDYYYDYLETMEKFMRQRFDSHPDFDDT